MKHHSATIIGRAASGGIWVTRRRRGIDVVPVVWVRGVPAAQHRPPPPFQPYEMRAGGVACLHLVLPCQLVLANPTIPRAVDRRIRILQSDRVIYRHEQRILAVASFSPTQSCQEPRELAGPRLGIPGPAIAVLLHRLERLNDVSTAAKRPQVAPPARSQHDRNLIPKWDFRFRNAGHRRPKRWVMASSLPISLIKTLQLSTRELRTP
jgi:hypothetical protein